MQQKQDAFKLGLTVIVAFALFFAGVIFIAGKSFEPREPIVVRVAHDQDVPRIKTGAAIVCGPRQVGSVTGVRLVEAPARDASGPKDFLYFEITGEVNSSLGLRSDCTITIVGPLLGDNGQLRVVNRGTLSTGVSATEPIYAEATGLFADLANITTEFDAQNPESLLARIKTQLNPEIPHSLVAKVHVSMTHVNAMTANLKRSVDPAESNALINKVDSILTHMNEITAALNAETTPGQEHTLVAKVHQGLDHVDQALLELIGTIADNREAIRNTVGGIEHVVAELDQSVMPAIKAELDLAQTQSLLSQARAAITEINRTLRDVGIVADKARRIVTLSEPRVLIAIDNAKEASAHLKALSKDLRRAPWRLIHEPDEIESRQAHLFDAVREFTEASALLDESARRLDALREANRDGIPADDPLLVTIREKLGATLQRFDAAEKTLWEQLDVE